MASLSPFQELLNKKNHAKTGNTASVVSMSLPASLCTTLISHGNLSLPKSYKMSCQTGNPASPSPVGRRWSPTVCWSTLDAPPCWSCWGVTTSGRTARSGTESTADSGPGERFLFLFLFFHNPTNIARVNLVMGCSKVFFFTTPTAALAY